MNLISIQNSVESFPLLWFDGKSFFVDDYSVTESGAYSVKTDDAGLRLTYNTATTANATFDTTVKTADKTYADDYCRLTGQYYDTLQAINHGGTIDADYYANGASSLNVQVCFPAGTPVILADGTTKNIEDILPGDMVKTVDHQKPDSEVVKGKVVRIFKNAPQPLWRLKFEGLEVCATKEHPFYVRGKGWVAAENLQVGDVCRSANDGDITLIRKDFESELVPVFNFEVEDEHTYFVGENETGSVLVHNECISLVHQTTLENAKEIIKKKLLVGENGLRWFVTSDAIGSGGRPNAKTQLTFNLNIKNVVEIPDDVIDKAETYANKSLKGKFPLEEQQSMRRTEFGRLKWEYIRKHLQNYKVEPGTAFQIKNPEPKVKGSYYVFNEAGWKGTDAAIRGIAGEGHEELAQALKNKNKLKNKNNQAIEDTLKKVAQAKWGDRIKAFGKWGGRTLVVVGVGTSALEIHYAVNKEKAIVKEVGAWTSAWAGAKIGAKIGVGVAAVVGNAGPQVAAPEEIVTVPLGVVIGGATGGIAGGIGGFFFGGKITEMTYEWVFE